jgi:hypothetical protein
VGATTESEPRLARLVTWANLFLFSLNIAWMTSWYKGPYSVWFHWVYWPPPHWPARIFHWRFWMPEPPFVLFDVVFALALSVPIFLALLPLARFARAHVLLQALPGAVAIVGYPLFALCQSGFIFGSPRIPGHEFLLILETVAVSACGVLYYLRRLPLPPVAGVLLLLAHFGLWGWVTANYANLFALIRLYPPEWRLPALEMVSGICIMTLYHYGFPLIGFLSALSSALCLRLSFGQAPSRR